MMTSERYEIRKKVFPMPTTGIILITGGNGALGLLMGQWLLGQYEKVVKRDGPPAAGTPPLGLDGDGMSQLMAFFNNPEVARMAPASPPRLWPHT